MIEKMSNEAATHQDQDSGAHEYHLRIADNPDALSLLCAASGLSKSQIKQAMNKGAVWHSRGKQTQRLRRTKKGLRHGDQLHFYYDPKVLAETVSPASLIADEGEYSVWYKPYGMRSQGSKWGDHTTINRYAEQHLQPQRNAFLIHRLDRAASGLILLAHSKKMAAQLSRLFQQREIDKQYMVIVHGRPEQERIEIDQSLDEKHARSIVSLLSYDATQNRSLLQVKIETGRKHQIRKHLSQQNLPVVGDRLYGKEGDKEDLQLVAVRLAFTDPQTAEERLYVLPKEWQPSN